MNNLMQALKLQLASSYKIYIANFILVIIGTVLAFFFGENALESYAYILGLEFTFTIVVGIYDYKVVAKTYYSLKHDRKYFIISSILINIINALIMLIIYFVIALITNNQIKLINVLNYYLSFIFLYSLANAYALYISKLKIVNFILLITLALFIILFGHVVRDLLITITNCLIASSDKLNPNVLIISSLILSPILVILNSIKYNKTY